MISLQHWIQTVWQREGLLGNLGWFALTPFSCGFSLVVRIRNQLYDRRWLSSTRQNSLKVISIGNLTVGGSGKTPVALWLAHALTSRGHKVGILTRGYKGKNTALTVVGTDGHPQVTPDAVGDEAVMLARSFSGVVMAGRDRVAGVKLAHERFGLEIAILDDGFQHRQLERDVNILLFNTRMTFHNRWLLPAGPFREPLSAIRRADVLLMMKGTQSDDIAFFHHGGRAYTRKKPIYHGNIKPIALINSERKEWRELPLSELNGKRIMVLTGIADPASFYHSLRHWEVETAEILEFPDHHQYSQADWHAISAAGQKVDLIVTTEKDLVKLERFPFATGKLVALRVRLEIDQEEALLTDIKRQLRKTG